MMLVLNLGQRVVGLLRNLGFCQFLSDAELGHWSLAYSFFIIAAPIAVLGLPGSFGKFVEIYRQRDCLGVYLNRVGLVCGLSAIVMATGMLLAPDFFAWLIYGEQAGLRIIAWTAMALVMQIGYNFVNEIALSLRQVRVLSWMQLTQGMIFAISGIWILYTTGDWSMLLVSYSLACLLGMMVGAWCVRKVNSEALLQDGPIAHHEFWPRILPFAVALWFNNLLANSFELSDRYMLLHFAEGGEIAGQSMVGQYYCGRIIPSLLTSFAMMLGGVLLPYLSKDWEAGRREAVRERMNLTVVFLTLSFVLLAIAALVASPLLFDWAFAGKYASAKSILDLSLVQCIWSSLTMVCAAYLFCAEKAKQGSYNLAIGLIVNLGLNLPLIHYYGLTGSVIATLIATFLVLLLTFRTMQKSGCRLDTRSLFFAGMPIVLLLGPAIATLALAVVIVMAGRTDWILSSAERAQIDSLVLPKIQKFRVPITSLWPALNG